MLKITHYDFNFSAQGNPTHPPLLFLHGFLGSHQDFQEVISLLKTDFYCLAVDLPGHGKTKVKTSDDYYKIENIAQGLIELLLKINIKKCFVVGYSMGGRIALYLALSFPNYFWGVILESASAGLKTPEERTIRRQKDQALAEDLETKDFDIFLMKWYNQPLFSTLKNNPQFPSIFAQRKKNNPSELAKCLRYLGLGSQPSLWGKLPENILPLLLVVGEVDHKFVALNQEMADLSPSAKLVVIPNLGHYVHGEEASSFVLAIFPFLKILPEQCKEI